MCYLGGPGDETELVETVNKKLVWRQRGGTKLQQLDVPVIHFTAAPAHEHSHVNRYIVKPPVP